MLKLTPLIVKNDSFDSIKTRIRPLTRSRLLVGVTCFCIGALYIRWKLSSELRAETEKLNEASGLDFGSATRARDFPLPNKDLTRYVRPLIGTSNDGNVCPGASVPFGMVKINPDIKGVSPPGYKADVQQPIRGFSMMHDSGTGGVLGSYGNFEIMPVLCPDGFNSCPTWNTGRTKYRVPGSD
ncbi:hypothetical protein O181_113013, partial [Austropuccinia psidii MF-1]|nr:hypothetical protein [Austropuccinia psidii MF-1]